MEQLYIYNFGCQLQKYLKSNSALAFSEYLKQQQGIQMPYRDGKREIRSGS